jgi:hypothetical protein
MYVCSAPYCMHIQRVSRCSRCTCMWKFTSICIHVCICVGSTMCHPHAVISSAFCSLCMIKKIVFYTCMFDNKCIRNTPRKRLRNVSVCIVVHIRKNMQAYAAIQLPNKSAKQRTSFTCMLAENWPWNTAEFFQRYPGYSLPVLKNDSIRDCEASCLNLDASQRCLYMTSVVSLHFIVHGSLVSPRVFTVLLVALAGNALVDSLCELLSQKMVISFVCFREKN